MPSKSDKEIKELSSDLFPYLAVGLADSIERKFRYPYPAPLQHALNRLAVLMYLSGQAYPSNFGTVLDLFRQPLETWWPDRSFQTLPQAITQCLPLLYEDDLHGQVFDYLVETRLETLVGKSAQTILDTLDQQPVEEMVRLVRQDPDLYGAGYVTARRFVIEHPWVAERQLTECARQLPSPMRELLGQMYEPAKLFDSHANHDGRYWTCPYCGYLLNWREGRPHCSKHDLCGRMTNGYIGSEPVNPGHGVYRLKHSIHARTSLPGKPELALLDELEEISKANPSEILPPQLWPGGDRYDLRVSFKTGEHWAIDVKDYASPYQLASRIQEEFPNQKRYQRSEDLSWDRFFYVVPGYRLHWMPGYLNYVKDRFSETQVISEEHFCRLVKAKLAGE